MLATDHDTIAPTPTSTRAQAQDLARRMSDKVLVEGALRAPRADQRFAVENPADLESIGHAPRCGEPDVAEAVRAAERAFGTWRRVSARERGDRLRRIADRVEEQKESLARLLALETGNALATQARPEVVAAIELLRLFAGFASELKGRTLPWDADTLCYTTRDPLGVVGAIIPWNAPLLLTAAKVGPAIIAGNSVVLKTAEQAPLAALRLGELMQEFLPPGVVNVVSGFGEEAGRPLALHPSVRKITFTGSCAVGSAVMHYAADKICPVTLELGGKSPNIVFDDADLDLVVPGILTGMRFTRQGQSCSAGSRILVHERVYDEVVQRVIASLRRLRIGDPLDEATEVGAIISHEQFERIEHYVGLARSTPGATVLCGGGRPSGPGIGRGYFLEPTLIEGIPHHSPVCRDEIFGPVATIERFGSFDDALAIANDTRFGLAAAVWTRDLGRAFQFVDRIEAGFVQVNQYITPRASLAYGGLKMSGLGKENSLESMLEHFTSSKTVIVNYRSGETHA
ncbi:MAG TPA: aldehyde dehydrogenase family protein [Casimicrobiaceae bacterium]|nr:aldehyde dehydrogenase family protein [Casimicrobiaceae bacterium]